MDQIKKKSDNGEFFKTFSNVKNAFATKKMESKRKTKEDLVRDPEL